jgi:hypothetical protein
MRTLLRTIAVLSALTMPLLSAHATTYTFTPTLTDTTTPGNVTGAFGSGSGAYSFNDPPTFTYDDSLNITASDNSDGDALAIDFSFSAPGTGSGSIAGDVDLDGRIIGNDIFWDASYDTIDLSNGSIVTISLPSFLGSPFATDLSSCGERDRGNLCGATDVTVTVWDNDPADPPPAATPEPSSLALLGTGVLGAAGLIRRRIKG